MKKLKVVFVVMHGELCEGGRIVSVHEDEEDAIKAALAVKTCFSGGWIYDNDNVWINGCDFVEVKEETVL